MAQPRKVKGLDPTASVPACLKLVLRTRIKEVFSYQSAALKGKDVEAVHDMRVAVRRLNAALAIFTLCFDEKLLKKYRSALKALLAALGDVRDEDIFIESLIQYKATVKEAERQALDEIIAQEQHARSVYRKQLKKTLRKLNEHQFVRRFNSFLSASL
jgi:triphosphatase